ncbi:MAG: hypothetical protein EOO86_19305 [Pedobacter sp.]|nr:MAG: hypothetical protein EOO86_19305 [Pedobacter sp.]
MEKKLLAELSPEVIREAAEMLDTGMLCFIDKYTGELDYYPDESKNYISDLDSWEETMNKIESNPGMYYQLEGMSSHESFNLMEDFIESLSDQKIASNLYRAISKKRPFRNFSDAIFEYPKVREDWFAFKLARYIDLVNVQIDLERR